MDREDDREERAHAEREDCPDEEKPVAAVGPKTDTRPSQVKNRDDHQQKRGDKNDDIARSPSDEHERSVEPDHTENRDEEVWKPSR